MGRKDREIDMEIKDIIFPNKAIGKYEGNIIKVKGGLKGQKVRVKLGRKKKDHIQGKILEIIEKAPMEKNIGCSHFGVCGGCTYQSLTYEDELKIKEDQVIALFKEKGLKNINFIGIEPSPVMEGYRNKMEYSFGDEFKDGPLALGLHKKGRYYEIVNVLDCNIVEKDFTIILQTTLNYFQEKGTSYYNKKRHKGVLRHLSVRKALSTGEILINLVTSSQEEIDTKGFMDRLVQNEEIDGDIVGILHTINDGLGDVVKADDLKLIYGKDCITEEILGLKFKISPFSFFQTNTFGAERLYSIVREFIGDSKNKLIFDLYSGTGTIAQMLSPICEKVIGIEIVEEAVDMARENVKLNGLENVEFIAGDVLKEVDNLNQRPDLIIIDPPREGIHPKAINKIINFNPDKFIYVSCNLVTLVRDLKMFLEKGYKIDKVKCMDMFPRTVHVECIALIQKKTI